MNHFQKGRDSRKVLAHLALLILVVCAMGLAACNWELNVYRVLTTTQVGYENYWRAIVELHDAGAVSDATYARAKGISERIYALGKNTTALMVSYQQIRTAEGKAKINAAVRELPRLVAELAGIASAFKRTSVAPLSPLQFEEKSRLILDRMEAHLAAVEALRPVAPALSAAEGRGVEP